MSFLNAKDVAYDNPGSVAAYYGWNPENINDIIASKTKGGSKNANNVQQHMDKFLSKRDTSMAKARPGQLINALDYAYREEGRKQQTKGGGFLDFLKKFIGPVVGAAVLPGVGGLLGAGISAGAGGAIGGAIQGGVTGGLKGAALGGLGGYGIGSGVGALSNFAKGLGGGFVNPSGLGLSGNNLALNGLANAPASTAAGGFGASGLGLTGANLALPGLANAPGAIPVSGYGPSALGGNPSSLYQPRSQTPAQPTRNLPFNEIAKLIPTSQQPQQAGMPVSMGGQSAPRNPYQPMLPPKPPQPMRYFDLNTNPFLRIM